MMMGHCGKSQLFCFEHLLLHILDSSPLFLQSSPARPKDRRRINPPWKSQWMLLLPLPKLLLLPPATAVMVRVQMKYLPAVQVLLKAMWKMALLPVILDLIGACCHHISQLPINFVPQSLNFCLQLLIKGWRRCQCREGCIGGRGRLVQNEGFVQS